MADDYGIESVALAFSAGVDGYLVKAISCEPLGGALRLIALGEKVMPSQIIATLTDPIWRSAPGAWESGRIELNQSDRKIQILRCLSRGAAHKTIHHRSESNAATVRVPPTALPRQPHVTHRTQAHHT